MTTATRHFLDDRDQRAVCRAWAAEHGYTGATGGWIYNEGTGRAICQGWGSFYLLKRREIMDWLTRSLTAFDSFEQMVSRPPATYCPTIRRANARSRWLADTFDMTQKLRSRPGRAWPRA
jgi:hypothetical protein